MTIRQVIFSKEKPWVSSYSCFLRNSFNDIKGMKILHGIWQPRKMWIKLYFENNCDIHACISNYFLKSSNTVKRGIEFEQLQDSRFNVQSLRWIDPISLWIDPISLKVRLNMLENGLVITMNYILPHADQMNISFHGESVRIKHFIFIRLKGVQIILIMNCLGHSLTS